MSLLHYEHLPSTVNVEKGHTHFAITGGGVACFYWSLTDPAPNIISQSESVWRQLDSDYCT